MPVSNWAGQCVLCGTSSCLAVGKRRTGCRVCVGVKCCSGVRVSHSHAHLTADHTVYC